VVRFGEPYFRGGHRENAILEGGGRCRIAIVVDPPIASLEPPVDGRREPKTQWQEGQDRPDQSIVFEDGIAIAAGAASAGGAAIAAGSHHQSGLFGGACGRTRHRQGGIDARTVKNNATEYKSGTTETDTFGVATSQ
jgi:hypothetical protein